MFLVVLYSVYRADDYADLMSALSYNYAL